MKNLLHKYAEGKLSAEEIDQLSEMLESTPDSALEDIVAEEWLSFEGEESISEERKRRLFIYDTEFRKKAIWTGSIAAGVGIILASVFFLHSRCLQSKLDRLSGNEVVVEAGYDGPSSVVLPDGTSVRLNARSSLKYSSDFGIDRRMATLTGEGYFDVAKDPSKEFTIHTFGMDVKVRGTKFNIYSYEDSDITELSLVEGRVEVIAGNSSYSLIPNEKVVLDRLSGRVNVMKTDNGIETSWLHKDLVFMHEPLYRVVDILQRRFGVVIKCSESIDLADRYTGTFRDRRINDILDVLKMHYGFEYAIDGNQITITK